MSQSSVRTAKRPRDFGESESVKRARVSDVVERTEEERDERLHPVAHENLKNAIGALRNALPPLDETTDELSRAPEFTLMTLVFYELLYPALFVLLVKHHMEAIAHPSSRRARYLLRLVFLSVEVNATVEKIENLKRNLVRLTEAETDRAMAVVANHLTVASNIVNALEDYETLEPALATDYLSALFSDNPPPRLAPAKPDVVLSQVSCEYRSNSNCNDDGNCVWDSRREICAKDNSVEIQTVQGPSLQTFALLAPQVASLQGAMTTIGGQLEQQLQVLKRESRTMAVGSAASLLPGRIAGAAATTRRLARQTLTHPLTRYATQLVSSGAFALALQYTIPAILDNLGFALGRAAVHYSTMASFLLSGYTSTRLLAAPRSSETGRAQSSTSAAQQALYCEALETPAITRFLVRHRNLQAKYPRPTC